MRCPKCKQDNSTSTGSRVITGGRSQNVYKCKACGELFEVDHHRKFSRNIGQMSNACEIVQIKNGVVVEHFKSIRAAAAKTGIHAYWIEKCLNGAISNINGYCWRRV